MKNNINTSVTQWRKEMLQKLDNVSGGTAGGSTGDASAAKQDITNATLGNILTELRDDKAFASNQVTDANGAILFREVTVDQNTGLKTYQFTNQSGAVTTPVFPLQGATTNNTIERKVRSVTRLTTTTAGTIPVDSISYSVINLGDGTNNNQTDFIFDGAVIPVPIVEISADGYDGGKYGALNYNPQGNTLFIQYETEA